jgi:CheY-like chemotaxis protein
MFDYEDLIVCCDETADDELSFRRAAKLAGVESEILFFKSGEEAERYFAKIGEAGSHLPSIIFLRYQMGPYRGTELLLKLRENPALKEIPVVFMTSPAWDAELFREPDPPEADVIYSKLVVPETFEEITEELNSHREKH